MQYSLLDCLLYGYRKLKRYCRNCIEELNKEVQELFLEYEEDM